MAPIPASKRPTTAGDYSILSLQIPPQQTYTTPSPHFLYVRAHEPKLPDPRSSRSLFIVNTPIDATETHFRTLFADHLGGSRVEQVEFESTGPTTKSAMAKSAQPPSKKRKRTEEDDAAMELPPTWDREIQRSGSAAVVIFVDKPSMEIALKHVKRAAKARTELAYAWAPKGDQVPALGSQRYKRHHEMQFPLKGDLQAAVDAYMISFTASEASRSRLLARQRAIPDEDGFITVTRGGRVGPARNEEAQEKQEELQKKEEEKRAGMGDFYRFQVREQKKQRAGDLVKRFQHDRRRVDDMRKQKGNRFKPRDRATTG